ncbi:cytochrome P450 [Mycena rebaudengoi]|nr:cytochrome P450 [Mycena rebaudengoi]
MDFTLALASRFELVKHLLRGMQPRNLATGAMAFPANSATVAAYLVDMIPTLKYVPALFIGAGFKRHARESKKLTVKIVELPFQAAKRLFVDGAAPPSYVHDKLGEIDENQDQEHQEKVIQDTAGIMYVGGFDTTTAALGTFILAMLANPDVQKRAQEETDAVVREGYLPSFDDEESLPYVSAIVKEILRWKPVGPIG